MLIWWYKKYKNLKPKMKFFSKGLELTKRERIRGWSSVTIKKINSPTLSISNFISFILKTIKLQIQSLLYNVNNINMIRVIRKYLNYS